MVTGNALPKTMEGKRQQTAAAMAGMSERSAPVWPVAGTKTERRWRTQPDPFDGVWEEDILPLLRGEAARSGQRQLSGWRRNPPAGSELRTLQDWRALNGPDQEASPSIHLARSGSNHRRPALPPPAVPAPFALRRGGCRRDLCGPEAGKNALWELGGAIPSHTLRQQLGPHP